MKNILIIDEDTTHIPHFIDQLKNEGIQIRHISDWRITLEDDESLKPDIIVLDLMMPKYHLTSIESMSGYTTGSAIYIKYLRNKFPKTPFVLFTAAHTESEDLRSALKSIKRDSNFRGIIPKDEPAQAIDALKQIIANE